MRPVTRTDLVEMLAADLVALAADRPARIAIDGPDAAGKTTLADELARAVGAQRPVVRVSVDDFHNPSAVRRRRGPLSPEGYYLDAFDLAQLARSVLVPLGPGGDRHFRRTAHDLVADVPTDAPVEVAPVDAVVLVDGVFLLRPELREHWDRTIYVHVEPEETRRRALVRDLPVFGSAQRVIERYERRYLPGQALYRADADPVAACDVWIDMTDPAAPSYRSR